jgi:hypothetical protein
MPASDTYNFGGATVKQLLPVYVMHIFRAWPEADDPQKTEQAITVTSHVVDVFRVTCM